MNGAFKMSAVLAATRPSKILSAELSSDVPMDLLTVPASSFFSFLFFLMMLFLGIDSAFSLAGSGFVFKSSMFVLTRMNCVLKMDLYQK